MSRINLLGIAFSLVGGTALSMALGCGGKEAGPIVAPTPEADTALPPAAVPDVILITLDTTRADVLSACGGTGQAPNLDRFAAESLNCTNAITPVPLTLPAHASMMTGLYPFAHGLRDNDLYRLDPTSRPLASILKDEGYRTEAVIAASVLRASVGLDLGFETYDEPGKSGMDARANAERPADEVTDLALARLGSSDERPLFLWVHYFDPHHPYVDHGDIAGPKTRRARYDSEVRFVDQQFGRLMQGLRRRGRLADSVVVVVGDHGESLGDLQEFSHGFLLEQPSLRVPFLVSTPSRHRGVYEGAVTLADVAPTILGALGLELPGAVHGLDVLEAQADASAAVARPLWIETYAGYHLFRWAKLEGVVDSRWKFVRNVSDELIALDRAEEPEVSAEFPEELERMRGHFDELPRQPTLRYTDVSKDQSAAETARLLMLGYLARGEKEGEAEPTEPLNPRDHYQNYVLYWDAQTHLREGDLDLAQEKGVRLIDAYPDMPSFQELVGQIYSTRKDYAAAVPHFERALSLNEGLLESNVYLGFCYVKLERYADAEGALRRALEQWPAHLHARLQLREALRKLRRFDGVLIECVRLIRFAEAEGSEEALGWADATLKDWLPATLRNVKRFGDLQAAVAAARAEIGPSQAPGSRLGTVLELFDALR